MNAADEPVARVMAALHAHLPLTLLVDLVLADLALADLALADRDRDDPTRAIPLLTSPDSGTGSSHSGTRPPADLSSQRDRTGPAP